MFSKKIKKIAGFTLIELLVVISIIGFLATAAIVSLNVARIKARDARRFSDLKQMNLALQMYYDVNGSYPNYFGSSQGALWGEGGSLALALKPYLSKLPFDPINSGVYYYAYWHLPQGTWDPPDCRDKYVLFAGRLEINSLIIRECVGITNLTYVIGQ